MEQFAQLLGGQLGSSVDVLGQRWRVFRDPRGRRACRGQQRAAECTRAACEDKRLDVHSHRFLKQIQSAGDIGIDEVLPSVSSNMRFVEGGSVKKKVKWM